MQKCQVCCVWETKDLVGLEQGLREPGGGKAGNGGWGQMRRSLITLCRILVDGQQSTFEVCEAANTCVCAEESYLVVMWKMDWSRERLWVIGAVCQMACQVGRSDTSENSTSNSRFFRKQN